MEEPAAMPQGAPYTVRFWGVRGSMPTPASENMRYGGNTSCVQIELSSRLHVVLDAGTGICNLGERLVRGVTKGACEVHLFLTHYHYDHLQGLAFFAPFHLPSCRLFFRGPPPDGTALQAFLERLISPPLFPVALAGAPSERSYAELARDPVQVADLVITPLPLNHPQGASGYRVDRGGGSLLYVTDHEHGIAEVDAALATAARGVGTLIIDSHFTPEEYERHRGWGHSTWREAAKLAQDAGVGRLILFHHNPLHTDADMDRIVNAARAIFPETEAAREGAEFTI